MPRRRSPSTLNLMTPVQRAWVAGLLEGEGCFSINNANRATKSIRIQVTMADLDVLEKLQVIVGGGTIRGPHKTRSKKHAPTYTWDLAGYHDCVNLINKVYRHLGERRRSKIDGILAAV